MGETKKGETVMVNFPFDRVRVIIEFGEKIYLNTKNVDSIIKNLLKGVFGELDADELEIKS